MGDLKARGNCPHRGGSWEAREGQSMPPSLGPRSQEIWVTFAGQLLDSLSLASSSVRWTYHRTTSEGRVGVWHPGRPSSLVFFPGCRQAREQGQQRPGWELRVGEWSVSCACSLLHH